MKSILIKNNGNEPQQSKTLEKAVGWFFNQTQKRAYGTITLRAVLHAGRIIRFERTVADRFDPRCESDGIGGEFDE